MSRRITDTDFFEELAMEELESAREGLRARDRGLIRPETALEAADTILTNARGSWLSKIIGAALSVVIIWGIVASGRESHGRVIAETLAGVCLIVATRIEVARRTRLLERARIAKRLLAFSPRAMGLRPAPVGEADASGANEAPAV